MKTDFKCPLPSPGGGEEVFALLDVCEGGQVTICLRKHLFSSVFEAEKIWLFPSFVDYFTSGHPRNIAE